MPDGSAQASTSDGFQPFGGLLAFPDGVDYMNLLEVWVVREIDYISAKSYEFPVPDSPMPSDTSVKSVIFLTLVPF